MIKIQGFSHCYDKFEVIKNLDLHVAPGDIYGFIGPNGAGKTTTIRFLATLLAPEQGNAWINSIDVRKEPAKIRRIIGFMPDHFGVYPGMTVEEFLEFFALAYGVSGKKRRQIINDILLLLDLQGKRRALASHLSRGMRQRLGLARTLLHDPPVLILDEPASGLDPRARIEIMELLKELQSMGKTILVSSHILSELASYCNCIGVVESGRMVAQGTIAAIVARMQPAKRLVITMLDQVDAACRHIERHKHVFDLRWRDRTITFFFNGELSEIPELIAAMTREGLPLLWIQEQPLNLEEIFMQLTQGKVQ